MMSFGALLRQRRLMAQLTQEELASRAGISTRSVSDIERGISRAPQKATVRFLAKALQLEGEDLENFDQTARASRSLSDSALLPAERGPSQPALTVTAPTEDSKGRRHGWFRRLNRPSWSIVALIALLAIPITFTLIRASPAGSASASFTPWGWSRASLHGWVARQVPSAAPTQFDHPSNIAVDSRGNVYVADALADTVTKLTPGGAVLARWGVQGTGRGEFDFPTGLAVDRAGNIYVADTNNNRIQKLSASGRWLASWGVAGSRLSHISGPTGVAVDGEDNVYIADGPEAQIIKMSPAGEVLGRWSPHVLEDPDALAVASDGTLFIADSGAGLVVRLSPRGKLLSAWHFPGFAVGQYSYPTGYPFGIAVSAHGPVYVTDTYRNRVLQLSMSGRVEATWGGPGSDAGEFDVPLGIAVDRFGHVYVGDRNNHRVQKFSKAGIPLPDWGAPSPAKSTFDAPRAIALDRSSHVYVLGGRDRARLQELSPQGLPMRDVVLKPAQQANTLSGLAVNDSGIFYVADSVRNTLLSFGPTGKLRGRWGTPGTGESQFHDPTDVALDKQGRPQVADSDNGRVQVFSASGSVLRVWYAAGYPQSVAVDRKGRTYVADRVRREVEQYSSAGKLVRVFGKGMPAGLRFRKPIAIAVSSTGVVYVADAGEKRVFELSSTGQLVQSWGGGRLFQHLQDVAVGRDGSVYVVDSGSAHVLRLSGS